jgi:exopolysaccharide production protein ExoZ
VVVFHATAKAGLHFPVGEAGVDLFFVLSGFLMVAITDSDSRPVAFLSDRLRRIAPIYWLATSVVLAGALIGTFPSIRLSAWHIVSSYLFIPSVSPSNGHIWPLLVPGWTLNYEMMFYVLFAGTLLLPSASRIPTLTAVICGLVLLGVLLQPSGALGATYSNPIMLEFVAGAWIGVLWKRKDPWPVVRCWPLITLALTILAASVFRTGDDARLFLYGLPAMLLVIAMLGFERTGHGIPHHPLRGLIGDASYSIYLWHTLAISIAAKLCGYLGLPPLMIAAVGVTAGMTTGVMAFHLIEKPLLRLLKPARTSHTVPAMANC